MGVVVYMMNIWWWTRTAVYILLMGYLGALRVQTPTLNKSINVIKAQIGIKLNGNLKHSDFSWIRSCSVINFGRSSGYFTLYAGRALSIERLDSRRENWRTDQSPQYAEIKKSDVPNASC